MTQTLTQHPIDPAELEAIEKEDPNILKLRDYDAEIASRVTSASSLRERIAWEPQACVQQIVGVLGNHINHIPRRNMPKGAYALAHVTNWSQCFVSRGFCFLILYPFLMQHSSLISGDENPLSDVYLGPKGFARPDHPLIMLFEVEDKRFPHITMVVEHHTNDRAGSNLRHHELGYILKAMGIRFAQRLFDEHQEQPVSLLKLKVRHKSLGMYSTC